MRFNSRSDYSINRKTNDIVYVYVTGESDRFIKEKDKTGKPTGRILLKYRNASGIETTRVLPNSEMTVKQFDEIKAFSDANYRDMERGNDYERKNTVSLTSLDESQMSELQESAEEAFFRHNEDDDNEKEKGVRTLENAMEILDVCLTKKQKKRFYSYYYEGKTQEEIAQEEGINQKTICESIQLADKKLLERS